MSFLIADPYPASDAVKPDEFLISGLPGGDVKTAAVLNPDGSFQLHYDLVNEPPGDYVVTVESMVTSSGVKSVASASFSFTIPPVIVPPVAPGVPMNVLP